MVPTSSKLKMISNPSMSKIEKDSMNRWRKNLSLRSGNGKGKGPLIVRLKSVSSRLREKRSRKKSRRIKAAFSDSCDSELKPSPKTSKNLTVKVLRTALLIEKRSKEKYSLAHMAK